MHLRVAAPFPVVEGILAALLAGLGFALTVWLFFPGIATHDALAVYDQAYEWRFGDWQPPLMGVIWVYLEPIFGFGPRAILLPTLGLFWLAIFLVFVALRRTGATSAWLIYLVAMLPPVFAILGVIWRDVIFSVLWLLAFALATLTTGRGLAARLVLAALALAAVMIGYWLRPNALFAAAPLILYVLWPRNWSWLRLIVWSLPIIVTLQATSYLINTTWLKARPDHVAHSILVFDLAGITHFSGKNAFPVDSWTPDQLETVISTCYQPNYWDAMWWQACTFAMEAINRDEPPGTKLFGSERLIDAWMAAIRAHPLAYLQHRFAFFTALMTWENMVVFEQSRSGQWRFLFMKSTGYAYFESAMLWLNANTPVFRGLTWLLAGIAAGLFALRLPNGPAKAAALTLSVSGVVFTLTYLPFGVAAEYRYVYWTALSSLAAIVVLLAKWENMRRAFIWRAV